MCDYENERMWLPTRYIPNEVTPVEYLADRRPVECNLSIDVDTKQGFTLVNAKDDDQNPYNEWFGFNQYQNIRFVPGDIVCMLTLAGAWDVFECPPAPEGNYCCTLDPTGGLTE